jgi:acetolactate synthase-1/2/3 large subunit
MKLHQAIAQWCADVRTPFVAGIPAAGIIEIAESLASLPGSPVPFALTRHEEGAAFMAYGYAFHTRQPAVVMASKAPGATNLAIGVAGAFIESLPMLVITQQVSNENDRLEAFEEMDLAKFFEPITKWSVQANNPGRVMSMLNEAYRRTLTGRPGPVHVALPFNFMNCEIDEPPVPVVPRVATLIRDEQLGPIVDALRGAERPLIIAGGGLAAKCESDVLALAEKLQVPIVASWLRKPVTDSHPNLLGMAGIGGSPAAKTAIAQADVVLVLGCRFSEQMTEFYRMHFAKGARLIHVDLDPAVIARVFPVEYGVAADIADVLPQLRRAVEASETPLAPARGEWLARLQAEQGSYRRRLDEQATPSPAIGGREVVRELRRALPSDSRLILDSGNYLHWAEQYFPVTGAGQFHYPTSGTMGYGIPGAIGTKFAHPDVLACALVGDGGFAMTMAELETAKRMGTPILVVIINNNMLGHIQMRQDQRYGRSVGSSFTEQHFHHVPKAFGIHTEEVDSIESLRSALDRAVRKVLGGETVVIDAIVTNELAAGPLEPWWNEQKTGR